MTDKGVRPVVTIVIPTRNRADLLVDCVTSVLVQSSDHLYEVVVVDDGSTDMTAQAVDALAAEHPGMVKRLSQPHRGLNAARNAGATAARGDLVAFLDDDAVVPDTYVAAIVEGTARHPDAYCFGGRVRTRFEGPLPRWCGNEPLEPELEAGSAERPIEKAMGGNLIIRRSAFERVGPFDESIAFCGDEMEWQYRARALGGGVMYLPDAFMWHRRPPRELRVRQLARRNFRKGVAYPRAAIIMQQQVSPWGGLRDVALGLGHAIRKRCTAGLVQAAFGGGHMWGAIRLLAKKGSRSSYLHWGPARRLR